MPIQGGHDLSWIAHGLHAACRRLRRTKPDLRIVGVVYSPADKRLAAIVEAASSSDVSDLFAIALLPSARVLEVWQVEENGPQFRAG